MLQNERHPYQGALTLRILAIRGLNPSVISTTAVSVTFFNHPGQTPEKLFNITDHSHLFPYSSKSLIMSSVGAIISHVTQSKRR